MKLSQDQILAINQRITVAFGEVTSTRGSVADRATEYNQRRASLTQFLYNLDAELPSPVYDESNITLSAVSLLRRFINVAKSQGTVTLDSNLFKCAVYAADEYDKAAARGAGELEAHDDLADNPPPTRRIRLRKQKEGDES